MPLLPEIQIAFSLACCLDSTVDRRVSQASVALRHRRKNWRSPKESAKTSAQVRELIAGLITIVLASLNNPKERRKRTEEVPTEPNQTADP